MQGASAANTILYLDSYGNRDPRKNGESADGFGCKEGSGAGNLLKGARLWNNVDDGLDLWEFKSGVTIEDTISWGNGFNRCVYLAYLETRLLICIVVGASRISRVMGMDSNLEAEMQQSKSSSSSSILRLSPRRW